MYKTRWSDFFWVAKVIVLLLPLYNIQFAWLALAFMAAPFLVTLIANNKTYCNNYCGRGQLYQLIGGKLLLSLNRPPPRFLRAPWFRYGFFALFLVRFGMMLYSVTPGTAESAAQLERLMLMTLALGLAAMVLFRPRSWCVCCPMGTMTQAMCRLRHGKDA